MTISNHVIRVDQKELINNHDDNDNDGDDHDHDHDDQSCCNIGRDAEDIVLIDNEAINKEDAVGK